MARAMFARTALAALALALVPACAPPADTPRLPAPAETRAQGAALAQACEGRDGWADPAPPAHIYGNTYYVGTCGIAVLLVTTPDGHALIDGAVNEAVPGILANISALGFDPRDVKLIVGSHEHYDHMGGFAALKAATGARLLISDGARRSVETGAVDAADPQFGLIEGMIPVAVDGAVRGGEPVAVGGGLMLTPVATPGHTDGGTSWTWQSCEGAECVSFAYVDSLSAVSRDGYRFADHPERVAPFRSTFARVAAMPCDILVTPHPSFASLFARLSGAEPLRNPAACRELAAMMEARLDTRLAEEAGR